MKTARTTKNPPELVAAVEASYGLMSAAAVALQHPSLTRNAVIGIWKRGRDAGRLVDMTPDQRREVASLTTEAADTRPLIDFTGAAAAILAADGGPGGKQRTCRWPNDRHPKDPDFRFCGAVVETPVIKGRDGQARPKPYCAACALKAKPARAVAPIRAPLASTSTYMARFRGMASEGPVMPLRFGGAGA